MPTARSYHGISVLIPSYSVEDLPGDLNEAKASGLLNAAACAWHPALIAAAGTLPEFRYADISDIADAGQILLVPECSEEWLGHEWQQQLVDRHCGLIHGPTERDEWLEAIQALSLADRDVPRSVVDDFLSLGLTNLFLSVLSRRMHHYIDPDKTRLTSAVCDAAAAALSDNAATCRDSLKDAFECLMETREQLYPVEIYLADVCLPGDAEHPELLANTVASYASLNLLISPAELQQIEDRQPDTRSRIDDAVNSGRCCVISGAYHELRPTLGTLGAFYADYDRGLKVSAKISGARVTGARVWGQRRFGLFHSLPGLLKLFGYDFALHVALDEGTYPEREMGSFRWTGPDQSTIPATSRLPIAVDSASAFLRLPERLAESIQQDSTVLLLLARLPEPATPWLDDLRRISSFVPVLGNFVTLSQFSESVDQLESSVKFDAGEYLPTHLIQSSVLRTEPPVSGPAELFAVWQQLDRLAFIRAMHQVLSPGEADTAAVADFEERLLIEEGRHLHDVDQSDPTDQSDRTDARHDAQELSRQIESLADTFARQIVADLPSGARSGMTVINTLPFARTCTVSRPADLPLPESSDAISGVWQQNNHTIMTVQLPPGGFVQIPETTGSAAERIERNPGKPLAEDDILRNEFFELRISESTGGIAEVRMHNQRANRVSQLTAYRYESARTIPETDSSDSRTVHYAVTRCEGLSVLESGPWTGAIESRCVVEDAVDNSSLFRFRQVTRVERTRPRVTIDIALEKSEFSVTGNPWMTYIACRFAWDNEMAAISRSVLGQACGFRGERFESPDFVEVADNDHRLLIVPHGRPYHRRSGNRMLDSLLVVEGESLREYRFTLEFDQPWPMRTVRDILQPPVVCPGTDIGSAAGWILGLSAKNVQLGRVRNAMRTADLENDARPSLVLLLQETEGRKAVCRIRTARPPSGAWRRRADGTTISESAVAADGISVEFAPFEVQEVELTF